MIVLTARSARTSFEGPEAQLKKMFRALRVKLSKSQQFWKAKYGYYQKYTKFYDRRSDTFQTGLLPRVTAYLERKGIKYRVEDHQKPIPKFDLDIKRFHFNDKVETRQEQLDMVKVALEKGRGILYAATNAGKTEVACAIISEYYRQVGKIPKVLFLIHRAGLVKQTWERFKKHLPAELPITMVGAGQKTVPRKGILVATVQTAKNLLDTYEFSTFQEKCRILFIDEFHVNKAWTCSRIAKYNSASMRFGLSGTINERNKTKMMHYIGMTGPIIATVRNEQLVNLGRSAKPYATFREVHADKIPGGLGFAIAYKRGIVKNKIRNRMVVQDAIRHLDKERKVLITVARIKHGEILKRKLQKKIDLRIEFLSGSTPLEVRRKVVKQFERGKVGVLIASPIFDTGVDIPAISGWVNSAGGKGWELVLQRLGRVLRKKKGVNKVYISDYVDLHSKYLMKHSLARIQHYLGEKIVSIKIV